MADRVFKRALGSLRMLPVFGKRPRYLAEMLLRRSPGSTKSRAHTFYIGLSFGKLAVFAARPSLDQKH